LHKVLLFNRPHEYGWEISKKQDDSGRLFFDGDGAIGRTVRQGGFPRPGVYQTQAAHHLKKVN
jgi:hypothetical protein